MKQNMTKDQVHLAAALVVNIKNHLHWIKTECVEGGEDEDAYMKEIESSVNELAELFQVQWVTVKTWDYKNGITSTHQSRYDSPLCNKNFKKVQDWRDCVDRLYDEMGIDCLLMCNNCPHERFVGECKMKGGNNE